MSPGTRAHPDTRTHDDLNDPDARLSTPDARYGDVTWACGETLGERKDAMADGTEGGPGAAEPLPGAAGAVNPARDGSFATWRSLPAGVAGAVPGKASRPNSVRITSATRERCTQVAKVIASGKSSGNGSSGSRWSAYPQ